MPNEPISHNIVDQIRQSFLKIEMSLTEVGLTLSDVVEMTTYHVGLKEQLEVFKQIKDEFINEPYPAWTAIGVSELAVDGALIEIRVIAKEKDSI
jgi:enamine deaminase RidA (YjgF/YER057c/UK114 family)